MTLAKAEWNNWLEESVVWDVYEDIPRRIAIHRLCKRGLIPFVESHGYVMNATLNELGSRIATGLFINRGKRTLERNWRFGYIESETNTPEYKYRYQQIIDTEEWEKFWNIWGVWSDLDNYSLDGHHRQYDIQEYIWTQLSVELSPHTRIVDEFLGIEENEDISELDGKDIYLKESSESNEWGGYRK